MKRKIKLIALDMDGTLFNHESEISKTDRDAIRAAVQRNIHVVISTGRPYIGLPRDLLLALGIEYAITTNGASLYRLSDNACIYSDCMAPSLVCPLIAQLQKKEIHIDAFIDGICFCPSVCEPKIDLLAMPASIRAYIHATRTFVEDLAAHIGSNNLSVQKMTLNFYPLPDGSFLERNGVFDFLSACPKISVLSGGYHNLEFTKRGVTKGTGLLRLCGYLNVMPEETMACGDTQNDIPILKTAAIGVAMGNAISEVKKICDYTTLSNEESGVGYAIRHFIG